MDNIYTLRTVTKSDKETVIGEFKTYREAYAELVRRFDEKDPKSPTLAIWETSFSAVGNNSMTRQVWR